MFTLTLQFLMVSLLPLSLIGMALFSFWVGRKRPFPHIRWIFTLLAAAVWASSLLRYYSGQALNQWVGLSWGGFGHMALFLTTVGVLLTTLRLFDVPRRTSFWISLPGVLFGIAALALDPAIWWYQLPDLNVAGQVVTHYHLWAFIWVIAWLLPLVAAWLLTQQARSNLDHSLFRNLTSYWLLTILLFGLGAGFATIQIPLQPVWQEVGVLIAVLAAYIGTLTLSRRLLPDLWLALRQGAIRLVGIILVFVILWVTLWFASRQPAPSLLVLTLGAGVLALLVTAVVLGGTSLTRRVRGIDHLPKKLEIDYVPDLKQLGQQFLTALHTNLAVNESWLFTIEDGVAGHLILRPLTALGIDLPTEGIFAADSPFSNRLLHQNEPLLRVDLATMALGSALPAEEEDLLNSWQRILYMPLHSAHALVGVVALGPKYAGQPFSRQDIMLLRWLSNQFAPILAQAHDFVTIQRQNNALYVQTNVLTRQVRHYQALAALQERLVGLLSPELKRPFVSIYPQLDTLPDPSQITTQIDLLHGEIEQLIRVAGQVEAHTEYQFAPVEPIEIMQSAMYKLESATAARRITTTWDIPSDLPLVWGDSDQLQAAIGYVLHNAVKFNRIGGTIDIKANLAGHSLMLKISDSGVGMPPEKIDALRNNFTAAAPLVHYQQSGRIRIPFGLTLAYFIISAHDGRLQIESIYGTGTTVSIRLPVYALNGSST